MTDPLLTIDEATRAFRTSPKTIRRRLANGEIAGAYKRPGGRGPEWVMPERSLVDAGFIPRRSGAPERAVPEEPSDRASYWERRALDAEAALHVRTATAPDRRRTPRVVILLCLVGALAALVLAFVVGRTTGGDDDARAPSEASVELVRSVLAERTEVGDRVGLVGSVPAEALPGGRQGERIGEAGALDPDHPRYFVAGEDRDSLGSALESLDGSAELVLAVPAGSGSLRIYDTVAEAAGADEPAPVPDGSPSVGSDAPAPSGEVPSPGPVRAPDAVGPGETGATDGESPDVRRQEDGERTVEVGPGGSFWSVAVASLEATGSVSEAELLEYWDALVTANLDRLVDPGNPDLLHVGQTLVLPPGR